jgi:8-oxo-dGTP diphosphatase
MHKTKKSHCYDYPRPGVTTDIVVFTSIGLELNLLLIQRGAEPDKGRIALPGGFLLENEDLDSCALRELQEETGVTKARPHHFRNFSQPGRDPRWVVTAAYFALVPLSEAPIRAGSDADKAMLQPIHEALDLPLAFDHREIVIEGMKAVARRLWEPAIALELLRLLPKQFTLSQVQKLYEQFEGRPLDRGNFRRKLKSQEIMQLMRPTGHTEKDVAREGAPANRPSEFYSLASPIRLKITPI